MLGDSVGDYDEWASQGAGAKRSSKISGCAEMLAKNINAQASVGAVAHCPRSSAVVVGERGNLNVALGV